MKEQLKKGDKKLLNAWAFYDWANSTYSLVIASAIFPLFYGALFRGAGIEEIEVFGMMLRRSPLIFYTTAVAFLIVALISPILSGVADYLGNKKYFLKFFCYMGALATIGLYWFSLDHIYLSLLLYALGLIGFWGSLVFYNSYLPDIAYPEQHDAISAKGYSLGYIGSVLLLIACLAMILGYETFGFEDESFPTRLSFVLTGVWWIGFSQYTYAYLPQGNQAQGKLTKDVFFNGFKELRAIWTSMQDQLRLKKYLIAFFVYSMAVQTVMLAAAYFGEQELEWGSDSERTTGLIVSILLIQLVAVLGAILTSKLSARVGNIKALVIINVIWIIICAWAYFVYTPFQFYITAGFVGLVMGGIQSLSRSTYAKFLPETEDTTSYFSFYDVAEKIGIIIGMFLYGFIEELTGSMRYSIVFLILFFAAGVVLLLRVPKDRTVIT
ncbi:UMF1 family MFS transporter [Dokdonia sp. Hel_I_63]|uniref:MFS transporter n=1 Tax=unclassified Dokdonia TaxID=2615033 RepID=UPI00020A7BF2|nr:MULTISPECIES: MFS transporter [unclassified Dokdonia]AEE18264.1 major facilitator superfamily MFS_1 [Dokdonia sp. 4H-3-7-5]TVZ22504.1 UMF1 family MFS transporter [Dokdonia sp. Hel_I_63]